MRRNKTKFQSPKTFPQLKKTTTRDKKKERELKRLKKQHALTQLRALPLSRRLIVIASVVLLTLLLFAGLTLGGWILYHYLREPTVILLGDANQTVEAFSSYEDPGISLKLGKKTVKGTWEVHGKPDTTTPATYEMEYTIHWHFRKIRAKRTVNVVDTTPPTLTLMGEREMTLGSISQFKEPGYVAKDRVDGPLTNQVQVIHDQKDPTHYVISYTVSDAAGNIAHDTRAITLTDPVPPVITLNGETHYDLAAGTDFIDPFATAKDDVDGDITDRIVLQSSLNVWIPGTYELIYSVTDAAGNNASVTRTVTVKPLDPSLTNRIYLTFDDGPSAEVTPHVLDALGKYNIKATFFVVNFDQFGADLLQRMVQEGHTVAIHGYSHDYAAIYASADAFMENVKKLQDKIYQATGVNPTIVRFPGGSSNTVSVNYCKGIMTELTKRLEQEGYVYFDWNVDSRDAEKPKQDKQVIVKNVCDGLRPGRENVILMHDAATKTTTADALEEIILYAQAQGYVFMPLTTQTPPVHHSVNN